MNVRYHVDGHLSAGVREVVEREVRFLDTRLATFADDLKSLDVTVHHQPRDDTYTSKLVLRLPSRTIVVAAGKLGATTEEPFQLIAIVHR